MAVRIHVLILLFLLPCPALPCTLCSSVRQSPTLRQEATQATARIIYHGTLANAKLSKDVAGGGTTEFHILTVIKADPKLPPAHLKQRGAVIVLNNYVPTEEGKKPPHYFMFCDVVDGKLDIYRSIAVTSGRTAKYLDAALKLDPSNVRAGLMYFFRHLDHADTDIANDAFMEFTRASDKDIGEMARELSPLPLRRWLRDPSTPAERLGLYAFLLGRCGNRDDVTWFQTVLAKPGERHAAAYDGILGGYLQLHPRAGWEMTEQILREGRQPLTIRLAVVRMLRFYQGWQPAETRTQVLRAMTGLVAQGELVDLAAEDLRRWKMWELTDQVLGLYGRKGLDAPIHKRAILRYALTCPKPAAGEFVVAVRRREAELVSEVEESLRAFERK